MPVRVYDIAKKLGLESKEILVKAKEMGIVAAKVPSSSLDKISAEWLEEEIIRTNPAVAARLAPKPPEEKPAPAPAPVEEPIVVIHEPPLSAPAPSVEVKPAPVVEAKIEPPPAPVVVAPPPVVVPPPPPKPQVGDLVGRIQLPVRPSSRPPERERDRDRGGSQQRTQPGARSGQPQRGDQRNQRGQQVQRGRDGRPQPGA